MGLARGRMGLAWGWHGVSMGLALAWGGMGSHGVGMGRMGPHGDEPTGPQPLGSWLLALGVCVCMNYEL
jgi:hypothetical protein